MTTDPTDPTGLPHARRTDPLASHLAAAKLTTGSSDCRRMLQAFRRAPIFGLTDEEAGSRAGLDRDADGKRGADLRRLGLIEWLREDDGTIQRRPASTGRSAGVSIITSEGIAALRAIEAKADA